MTNPSKRKTNTPESIAHEVKTALGIVHELRTADGESGSGAVRVREDGAVCFGGESVVIKAADDGVLDVKIRLFSCPAWVEGVILERLKEIAAKGVRITYHS